MSRFLHSILGIDPDKVAASDSWRIELVAEYGNYTKLAMIGVLALMVYLTIRSYRREGDTPRGAKVTLSILRILVVVLALLVLFRPALILRFTDTIRSSVLFLVDDSKSMETRDTYAKNPRGDAVAKKLGLPRQELGDKTRTELLRAALARADGPLAKLARHHPLLVLRYSTDDPGNVDYTRPLARVDLPAAEGAGAEKLPPEFAKALAQLSSSGFETNLARALYDVLTESQGQRVAGIVMIGDGQATAGSSEKTIREQADRARRRGVPIYTVMVGDDTLPTNVAVTSLQARKTVVRSSPLILEAHLTHRNLGGRSVTLRLMKRAGKDAELAQVGKAKTVTLVKQVDPDSPQDENRSTGSQTEELTDTETDKVGTYDYKAVVEVVEGEKDAKDNASLPVQVEVTDEKVNVLLISGDAGWEFMYLRNLLLRQEDLFRVSIWQQNADKEVKQLASRGMELKKLPATLTELMGSPGGKPHPGYRVVILYDPQPSLAKDDQTRGMNPLVKLLKEFVDQGGGLCYVAGNKHSASLLEPKGPFRPLADMLPVSLRLNTIDVAQLISNRPPTAWPLRLTTYGLDHAIMAIGRGDERPGDLWPLLPGFYWSHPVYRLKPVARVLAESTNSHRRTADGEPEPVIATQTYGTGRVLYVGADATWRWRFLRDGKYHRRFWINVVQHLASPKARHVVILAGGDRFDAGKEITVEVKARDEEYKPRKDPKFRVELIETQTGTRTTLVLPAVEGKPGEYKKSLVIKRAGKYRLTALWDDRDRERKVQDKDIVIQVPKGEAKRPEANPTLLNLMASNADGFMHLDEIDRLTKLIPSEPLKTVREEKTEFWDSSVTLALIVVLLGIEWILRKKYNMA